MGELLNLIQNNFLESVVIPVTTFGLTVYRALKDARKEREQINSIPEECRRTFDLLSSLEPKERQNWPERSPIVLYKRNCVARALAEMNYPNIKPITHPFNVGILSTTIILTLVYIISSFMDRTYINYVISGLCLTYIVILLILFILLSIYSRFSGRLFLDKKKYRATMPEITDALATAKTKRQPVMIVDEAWANLKAPFAISFSSAKDYFADIHADAQNGTFPLVVVNGTRRQFNQLLGCIDDYCCHRHLEKPKILVLDKRMDNIPFFRREASYYWFSAQLTNCNRFISPDSL